MNCKPGDLAYIICGDNAGRVVEVLRNDPIWSQIEGVPYWEIHSVLPLDGVDSWGRDVKESELSIADSRLRPISGVPLDEETPVAVNLPEAFKLALGIERRDWVGA